MAGRAQLSEAIAKARRIVVFTGAGISTESGVPDFRSPGGVWSKMKPIYFQEFVGDEGRRREAWTRVFSGAAKWTGARPNDGHTAVARLVRDGRASAVITERRQPAPGIGRTGRQGHRVARQCALCALPGLRPATRVRRISGKFHATRRNPGLPRLRRPREVGDHLIRPVDAAGPDE